MFRHILVASALVLIPAAAQAQQIVTRPIRSQPLALLPPVQVQPPALLPPLYSPPIGQSHYQPPNYQIERTYQAIQSLPYLPDYYGR